MGEEILSQLPSALQGRLDAIMARRPAHICGAHWLALCEGAERVEVLSCKCRNLTGNEARLLRQISPSSPIDCCVVSPDDPEAHSHGPGWPDPAREADDAAVVGLDDEQAARLLALRARMMGDL